MNDAQFKRLPRLVAAYARAGWFQVRLDEARLRLLPDRLTGISRVVHSSSLLVIILLDEKRCETDDTKAILNLRWSRNPTLLTDSLEKALAAVTTATYWATALWYMSQGDKPTSGLVTVVGGLQAWSAFLASK